MSDTTTKSVADPGFPRGGTNSKVGTATYYSGKFSRKLHEKWARGALKIYLCRSASVHTQSQNFLCTQMWINA